MIEIKIKDYLSNIYDCPVILTTDEELPEKCILLQRLSTKKTNKLYSSSFAIQSYDTTEYKAATLNESVVIAMEMMEAEETIASVRLDSEYPFNDTERKRYRYQAVFDIAHY